MEITSSFGRVVVLRALTILALAGAFSAVVPACSGSDGGPSGSGCAIGGDKCAYGCTANIGCTECVSDADCSDSGKPACALGKCQECGPGAGCGAAEACFPRDFKCQAQCATDSDCPGDAPICLADSGVCVGCQGDADCAGDSGNPICDPTRSQCSECGSPADCGAAAPVCDRNDGKCHECLVDSDCTLPRACGVDRKCHLACSSNVDCDDAGKPFCDLAERDCVECLGNQDCGAAAPICSDRKCAECGVDADCRDPAAAICKGEDCVECAADPDCSDPTRPLCKGDVCVACDKDKDCNDPAFPKCSSQQCVAP